MWWFGPSGDDGAVDVGEDPFLHAGRVDCGDHSLVCDRDNKGGAVYEHQCVPRALGRGAADAVVQPLRHRLVERDAAALQPLERMAAHAHLVTLFDRAAEHRVERQERCVLRAPDRGRPRRAADAGWLDRRVVTDRLVHATGGIAPGATWAEPAVTVVVPVLDSP